MVLTSLSLLFVFALLFIQAFLEKGLASGMILPRRLRITLCSSRYPTPFYQLTFL